MAFVNKTPQEEQPKKSKAEVMAAVKIRLEDQVKGIAEKNLKKVPQSKQKVVANAAARSGLKKSGEFAKSDSLPSDDVVVTTPSPEKLAPEKPEVVKGGADKGLGKKAEAFAPPQEISYEELSVKPIKTESDLEDAVEREIDGHYGGIDLLFTQNEKGVSATSVSEWAKLLYSYMETGYDMGQFNVKSVESAVRAVKNDHRPLMLSNMANNLVYATTDTIPYSVANLKELMIEGGAYLEDQDDEVLEQIFEGQGTIEQEDDDPSVRNPKRRPGEGGMTDGDGTIIAVLNGWTEVTNASKFTCKDIFHTPKGRLFVNDEGVYYGADNTGHVGWGFKMWTAQGTQLEYKGNLVWDLPTQEWKAIARSGAKIT